MKQFNRVSLELGDKPTRINGLTHYVPEAYVTIETENEEVLKRIIVAIKELMI